MQGAGNDYIYIDIIHIKNVLPIISKLCDRHYGIGGDGVVFVDYVDKRMIMYNADGSRGAICGNALRCVGHLLYLATGEDCHVIHTDVGDRTVVRRGDKYVAAMGESKVLGRYDLDGNTAYLVDVGNLHLVVSGEYDPKDVAERLTRFAPQLVGHVNVEVIQDELVEVYERGTGYTLSCGSGAVAVATAMWESGLQKDRVDVKMPGGVLVVSIRDNINYLEGNAVITFRGQYDIE